LTSAPPDPRARRVIVVVFFTAFLDLAGFGIIIPLLPLYVKSMGGTAETVGILLSSFSLTQFVATPFLGRLSDAVGRRRVIVTSLAGNAVSMMLFAGATGLRALPLLFVSRILAGATAGNLAACQAAVADVTTGSERARGMGRIGAGIGLGLVFGPAMGGWASKLGPMAPPLVAAVLVLVDLVATFLLMPETYTGPTAGASRSSDWRALGKLVRERSIVAVLALYFLTFLSMTTLQVALPLLVSSRFRWSEEDVGHVFALYGLVGLLTQGLLIGRLMTTLGARNILLVGALASCIGLLVIAFAAKAPEAVAGMVTMSLGVGLTNPVLSTLASEYAGPGRQGAVLGVAQSAGGLARTVGPIGSGVLYARLGPTTPFVGGAFSSLLALVVVLSMRATRPDRCTPRTEGHLGH
jgi:DHA1 family tetracycline resistance protein-like MFS transporter